MVSCLLQKESYTCKHNKNVAVKVVACNQSIDKHSTRNSAVRVVVSDSHEWTSGVTIIIPKH